jgi:hypothetical protein
MSKWSEYKEKNGVTPLDMLNPMSKHAEPETSNERYEICKACPEFFKPTHQCKKCGCIMTAKTKLEAAKCPIGKW